MKTPLISGLRTCLRVPLVREVLTIAAALVIWKWYSSGLQDAILWCLFLYGLRYWRQSIQIWARFPGWPFLGIAGLTLLLLPLSTDPQESSRELVRVLDVLAVAAVLPGLLQSRERVQKVLLHTGTAFTLVLGADFLRLSWILKAHVLTAAHEYEPFALGHSPNVAGAAAACGFIIMSIAASRCVASTSIARKRPATVLCICAALINLAYLVIIASRGAQVALAATAVLAAFLFPRRHTVRLVMAGLVLLAIATAALKPEWINPRFKDPISMKGLADRDKVWQHTWALSKERPIIGHGYGNDVFKEVYHNSSPPKARFHFNHPHQYWLNVLFAGGWLSVTLHLLAWSSLGMGLLKQVMGSAHMPFPDRSLLLSLLLLIAFIHVFGLGDYPGSVIRMLLIWLVPLALVCLQEQKTATDSSPAEG